MDVVYITKTFQEQSCSRNQKLHDLLKGIAVVEQDRPLPNSFLGLLLLGINPTIFVLAAPILNQKFTKQDSRFHLGRGFAWSKNVL